MTKAFAIISAGIVAIMLVALVLLTIRKPADDVFAACRQGAIAGGAGAIGGPFQLVDQNGRSVTEKDVFSKPGLLYFGYTFCPDVCPFDVARNAEAIDVLDAKGFDVNPVFITIDPARDDVEALADYAANMHEKMIALTGTPEQIKAASQAYKTYYSKQDGDDEFYLVDHSTFTYLVLPEYGFVEFFRRDLSPEDMAQRTACFLNAA